MFKINLSFQSLDQLSAWNWITAFLIILSCHAECWDSECWTAEFVISVSKNLSDNSYSTNIAEMRKKKKPWKVLQLFKTRWSLYVPPGITFKTSHFVPTEHPTYVVYYSHESNLFFFVMTTERVYCAVRSGSLYIIQFKSRLRMVKDSYFAIKYLNL